MSQTKINTSQESIFTIKIATVYIEYFRIINYINGWYIQKHHWKISASNIRNKLHQTLNIHQGKIIKIQNKLRDK